MGVEAQLETEVLRDALSKPIKIERDEVVTSIPLQTRSGMLHLTCEHKRFHWRVCVRYWLTHSY